MLHSMLLRFLTLGFNLALNILVLILKYMTLFMKKCE